MLEVSSFLLEKQWILLTYPARITPSKCPQKVRFLPLCRYGVELQDAGRSRHKEKDENKRKTVNLSKRCFIVELNSKLNSLIVCQLFSKIKGYNFKHKSEQTSKVL